MRVTPHVHCLWLEFEITLPGGRRIPRFVTSCVIEGERLALVDTSVAPAAPRIIAYIESLGRKPGDLACVVNTHSHFDHIGGNGVLAGWAKPRFHAHPLDRPWIEDLDLQDRGRHVPGMRKISSGPVRVEGTLEEGGEIDLGGGVRLRALHTPGHSPGSLSLFVPGDGALISGDVLPEPGTLPIYEDVHATLASLDKLRALQGAEVLLSAMSRRVSRGGEVAAHLEAGEGYIRRIDRLVREAQKEKGAGIPPEEAGRFVFQGLGLPLEAMIGIVSRTFAAHLAIGPLEP
ncbi:MAG: MBL fold metallo-hydrolase [Nitrospinota bacterium]